MMARKMKDSGVEWIGEIPAEWKLMRIKNAAVCNANTLTEQESPELEFDYVDIGSVENGKGITCVTRTQFSKAPSRARRILEANDVIISTVRTYLKAIASIPDHADLLIGSTGFLVLSAIPNEMNPRFMYYACVSESLTTRVEAISYGVAYPATTAYDISNQLVAVPPVPEQRCIADYLDSKCSALDNLMENIEAQITKLDEYKKSVITQAVTKGLDPNVPMKDSGVEWMGEIPSKWSVSKLKYVSDLSPRCKTASLSGNDLVCYAPMECIKGGYFTLRTVRYSKVPVSLTPFEKGDIVIAKVTPCFENGNIAIMTTGASGIGFGSSELYVLRATRIETRFLFYWLQNQGFRNEAISTMTGMGGLKRVSSTYMRNAPIAIPCESEQTEIVNYLDSTCGTIILLKEKFQAKLTNLAEYKKSLIFDYVTGKKEVPESFRKEAITA